MILPTEPIGSIPRPPELVQALQDFAAGRIDRARLDAVGARAVADTLAAFERTGSPVVTDGEQTKPSFATYPIAGLASLAPDGVVISFADGHRRQLPRLTAGPFRYGRHTDDCGFSPFADDQSTSRETAFAKTRSRVPGTEMALRELGH